MRGTTARYHQPGLSSTLGLSQDRSNVDCGVPEPLPSVPRRILLVDADAFFVAVARWADPEGAGRAPYLLVGGTAEGRGIVCSASYSARAFGVKSAMPMSQALRLCPEAMCVPVPGKACRQKHREIRAVLEKFSPVVQSASIDEWYVDLAGTEAYYEHAPLDVIAHRMADGSQR